MSKPEAAGDNETSTSHLGGSHAITVTAVRNERGRAVRGFLEVGEVSTEIDSERCLELAATLTKLAMDLLREESRARMFELLEADR